MPEELIYTTTDPRVLTWWEAVRLYQETVRLKRNAYAERISAELGLIVDRYGDQTPRVRSLYETRLFLGGSYLTGVETSNADYRRPKEELLALGWRIDSKTAQLKPALRTEEGKAIRDEWDTLSIRAKESEAIQFGVIPEFRGPTVEGITMRYFPGFHVFGDNFYVTYGSSYGEEKVWASLNNMSYDTHWEEVPRREWRKISGGAE